MAEYIERGALMQFPIRRDHYDRKNGNKHFINGIESVLEYAENLPAADVAPVVHGRWIHYPDCGVTRCSHCGWSIEECWESKHCPECGARIDGDEQ